MYYLLKQKKIIIAVIDFLVLVFAFFAKNIAYFMMDNLPACFVAEHGYLCPSCGGTRCVYNFFSGNFVTAFVFNPFLFLIIIYFLLLLVLLNLSFIFNNSLANNVLKVITDYRVIILIAVLFGIFGILRNFI